MSEKLILFQGDSITDAGRTSSSDPFYALGCGYPLLTAARLLYEKSHTQYHFLNKGISGNRIVDLYARWKEDTLNQKPDVISILIGVNDVWHEYQDHSGVDASKFENMYDLLLEETKAALPQVQLVLCEPFILPIGEVLNHTERWMTDMALRRVIVKKWLISLMLPLSPSRNPLYRNRKNWVPDICFRMESIQHQPDMNSFPASGSNIQTSYKKLQGPSGICRRWFLKFFLF
ncbi:GDSL-type esterase/lipase family protein [Robinsoniella peoriensis]